MKITLHPPSVVAGLVVAMLLGAAMPTQDAAPIKKVAEKVHHDPVADWKAVTEAKVAGYDQTIALLTTEMAPLKEKYRETDLALAGAPRTSGVAHAVRQLQEHRAPLTRLEDRLAEVANERRALLALLGRIE